MIDASNTMYYYGLDYDDYYLAHHGKKGMKWGVRKKKKQPLTKRIKNRYDSLTPTQKKLLKYGLYYGGSTAVGLAVAKATPKITSTLYKYRSSKDFERGIKATADTYGTIIDKRTGKAISEEAFEAILKAKGVL